VYDFDNFVRFWNPQSICIDQVHETQFSVLPSASYFHCPVKHLLIYPQKNIERCPPGFWQCTSSQFATLFMKDWSRKSRKSAAPIWSPRHDLAPSDSFFFVYLKEKLCGTSFTTNDDLIFAIRQIFSESPEMEVKNVLPNWITRLSWMKKKGGGYCTK
jgi:hypothetical protein